MLLLSSSLCCVDIPAESMFPFLKCTVNVRFDYVKATGVFNYKHILHRKNQRLRKFNPQLISFPIYLSYLTGIEET